MPRTMTVREVSKMLNVHPNTVYRLVREGVLPHYRVRRKLLFSEEHIERLLAKFERNTEKTAVASELNEQVVNE